MPDTGQNVIDRARTLLLMGINEQFNKLAGAYTAGNTTVSLTYPIESVGHGARLGIGQNVFIVWDADRPSKIATVTGGQEGSTDINLSNGAIVRVNPRYTDFQLFTTLNQDLADLTARGLFQMKVHEFTYVSTRNAYDLPVDLLAPYALSYQTPDTHKDWPYLPVPHWRVERNANTTDFPSGTALHLFAHLHNGYKVRLQYKAPFVPLAAVTDTVGSVSGLPTTAADLPELGIATRLLPMREAKRNYIESQANPRKDSEVPPGSMLRAAQGVTVVRERRINAEIARLRAQFPDRTR